MTEAERIRIALRRCRCLVPKDCPECRPLRERLKALTQEGRGEYLPQTEE